MCWGWSRADKCEREMVQNDVEVAGPVGSFWMFNPYLQPDDQGDTERQVREREREKRKVYSELLRVR